MTFRTVIGISLLAVITGCAKIGAPTGGPEDVLPPQFISGTPENRSINFSDDQIDINFNEYIQLKDQNREVTVSPPMNEKPVIRVREKSIRVLFNEDLLPGTTYTINFGKSISDLNEGNLLPDFEYVLSTGDVIDSLSVTGKVIDAFTHEPTKEGQVLVMLYENLSDSAPVEEIPRYYTRANMYGLYAINNIRPDTYRIVSVHDGNNNLKYDPGLEKMAFADSLLVINPETVKEQTFIKDTIKIITPAQITVRANRRDTASVADTVIAPGKKLNAVNVTLYSFMEYGNRVMVTSRTREIPEKFTFTFNRPLIDSLKIEPLNFEPVNSWVLPEYSQNHDTLAYWITDTTIARLDTLRLKISYMTADSAGFPASKSDTVRLRKPASPSGGGRGGGARRTRETAATGVNELVIKGNVSNNGTINLNSFLTFTASKPISRITNDSIDFAVFRDTVLVPLSFKTEPDTTNKRTLRISTPWDEDTRYKIVLKPGTIYDVYGKTNDSIELIFNTRPSEFYGRILLNFSAYVYPMIIQLKNEKGSVVRTSAVDKPGLITFNHLVPGRYSFKAIYDENGNDRWDTGSYLNNQQPEKVFLSGQPQQLRSNWDWETSWSVTENSMQ